MKNYNFSNENSVILDHYKTIFKMPVADNDKKIDISILKLLIALYVHLVVMNSWLSLVSNDHGHLVVTL